MFYGTLLFLIGFGAVMTRCSADRLQELNASRETCATRFNLSEIDAALSVVIAGTADDYTVVTEQQVKCFVDCIERESGALNADDEFDFSKSDGKTHSHCARTVENWGLWNRTNKCLKGYLFFKCAVHGEAEFNGYMDTQSKIASGELKPADMYEEEHEQEHEEEHEQEHEEDGIHFYFNGVKRQEGKTSLLTPVCLIGIFFTWKF